MYPLQNNTNKKQNKKARFDYLLRPPAWKRYGPILKKLNK